MGVALPLALFYLLGLQTWPQLLTISLACFFTWGVADLLASILERPRLKDRSPAKALREDLERRQDVTASHSSSAATDRS